jgi:lipopolysaccharide/colanic/teichoic acid biosynthesis glycosyltransferase
MNQSIQRDIALEAKSATKHPGPPPPSSVWQNSVIEKAMASGPYVRFSHRVIKRLCDLIVALVALLLTAWLWGAICLAIKLTSKGPLFFRQWRPGLNRKPFLLLKFRTMIDGAEGILPKLDYSGHDPDGILIDIPNDPRVTRLGRILRKTSLDELPQFINILRGEMSLVGPRPFARSFTVKDSIALKRFAVKPGLTGIWQVKGRKDTTFAEAVDMDLEYVSQWSLINDGKIILQTIGVLLRAKGAR